MKTVQKLSLLALVILTAGCNEKVSPELMQSNATTPDSTVPIPPSEYYFKVANTSDVMLNYKLHKTGNLNSTAACEVRNTTGLSSDIFRGDPVSNDITCFFDAEELSLFNNGMNYQIEASANTCDYVAHTAFSFYDQIPGDSSGSFTQIECTNDTTSASHVITAAGLRGINITSSTTPLECGDWGSNDIAPIANRLKFVPTSDEELCRFNYPDTENDCDIGEILVNKLAVTYTPPGDDPITQPATLKHEVISRIVTCGGTPGNCTRGAHEEMQTYNKGDAWVTEISQPELNKDVKVEFKLPQLIGKYGSTKKYANFRRDLASTQIDYVSAATGAPTYAAYKSSFGIAGIGKIFNPGLMDMYSANKLMDGTPLVTGPMIDAVSYPFNMYKAVPLAAEPYIGLMDKVSAFYSFYCLDTAFDIKARVRMVVRDWDRIYPTNTDNEYLSDIWRGASSRQDNPGYVELPGDEDIFIPFNDMRDWDDQIPMTRTAGPYSASGTVWEPVSGFFNVGIFTAGGY